MAPKDEQERQARELYNNPRIAPCTGTVGVINQLVDHAQFILGIQDVKKIMRDEHSAQVVLAFFEMFEDTEEIMDIILMFKDCRTIHWHSLIVRIVTF